MDYLKIFDFIPRTIQLLMAFLMGVAVILLIVANPLANSIISKKLNSEIKDSIFVVSSDVNINIFSGNIKIEKINIFQITKKDSSGIKKSFDFKADRIIIEDFKILRFILSKKIKSDSIAVYNPIFKLHQLKKDSTKSGEKGIQLNGLFLRKFAIVNGDFSKIDKESNEELLYIKNLNFKLTNFKLHKDSILSLKTIHFDNIEMASSKFMLVKNNALYGYAADSVFISTKDQKIEITDCSIIPQYSKYKFARVAGKQTSRIDCKIPKIEFVGFNLDAFLKHDSLLIQKAVVSNFYLEIFKDTRVPRPNNLPQKPLPQEILRDLEIPVKIDSIICSSGYIAFEGRSPGSKRSGKMNISKSNISILNICNIKDKSGSINDMKILFDGYLMGEGKIKAGFNLPLSDLKKPMTYSGQISRMDLRKFNPYLKHSLFMKIRSGKLNKLKFNATANNNRANGELKVYYKNLKVSVQKFNNKELSEYASLEWLLNLLINSFLIKKNNPSKKKELRVGNIDFERDKSRIIVHYWINSILSGVTESLGVPPKINQKTSK